MPRAGEKFLINKVEFLLPIMVYDKIEFLVSGVVRTNEIASTLIIAYTYHFP